MDKLITSTIQIPSTQNQNSHSNDVNEDNNYSATLLDLEALHCPICCDLLTEHIYQCDNGHIVCYTCGRKLRNKCPSCSLSIGGIRCRALERVVKEIIVPCPNAKLGCSKRCYFGTELTHHEKECFFSLCSCPVENCNYNGLYWDLYSHFFHHREAIYNNVFNFGEHRGVYFGPTDYVTVMKEVKHELLFAVQCFREPNGVYVTMSCIAPPSGAVYEFSSHISTNV